MKNKNILIGTIVICVLACFFGGFYLSQEIFFNKNSSQEGNDIKKTLYFYESSVDDKKSYYVSERETNDYGKKLNTFGCKTEDCIVYQSFDNLSTLSYELIQDGDYYLFNIINGEKIKFELENKKKYQLLENAELLPWNVVVVVPQINDNKCTTEDLSYYFMDIKTGKMSHSIVEKNYNTCDYPSLDILKHENNTYYVTKGLSATFNYYNVYNSDFQRILSSSNYGMHQINEDGDLVVTKSYVAPVYYGAGYEGCTNYEVYNQDGKFIQKSKNYKMVWVIGENHFVAVDQDNMLKIFDYSEDELVSLELWSDNKAFSYGFKNGIVSITTDIPTDSNYKGIVYTFDLNKKTLNKTEATIKLQSK